MAKAIENQRCTAVHIAKNVTLKIAKPDREQLCQLNLSELNFFVMRKVCSSIMFCLAMVLLANAHGNPVGAKELVTDIIIVRDAPPSTKPRVPEKEPLSFYGYVAGPMNSLVLSSNKTVDADVCLENLTSGDHAEHTISITTNPVFIDMMGLGSYHLTISLSAGDTYSGYFDL